ncbi:MAG TPA: hypothetical protein VE944_33470 [Nostoc sp.]|uniref:hypothetical protein n=1 Tax=Nostoc sp. TaxID=1180 RepID=UPI002D3A5CD2|nr:hypothetical protein [Nostoc sp.]HYX19175.1 hypothetical protein [Nostoc sp.]
MKKFMILVALSIASEGFAEEEGEHMEVTAPSECCGVLPGGLGLVAGFAGASGASAGTASLTAASLKAATKRAAEQRARQEQQTREQQQTQFSDAIQTKDPAKQSNVWDFLMNLTDNLLGGGQTSFSKSTTQNEDGTVTETETQNCQAGGPLNPNNVPCTQHKFELFTDPTDGVEKWAYTMAVIEPKYNPKHYYAEPSGYYASVIDDQSFTIVFESKEELLSQLRQIGGR